ncbi:MAG TPA: hypothetical protein VH854_03145 [Thermoanaerobaculia bacterium]|jgi:hypothetical protein|nr:hypothetical protein [Thermoanaerobaculia bacterium]
MKRLLLFAVALALFAPTLRAADDAAVRVFVLKHKRVEEAMLLIRPHLSESASITLTQKLNAMTVTDKPDKLDQVAKVLASFDVPPRGFQFAIKLVRARADVPAGSISKEIGGLGTKLKSLFQFNDYSLIDSAVLRSVEGGHVEARFGPEYQLAFTIRSAGAGNDLVLSPFVLYKLWNPPGQAAFTKPLYRAAMPVSVGQTLVVGASKEEASKSALILILLAEELPRADAPDGKNGPKSVEKRP